MYNKNLWNKAMNKLKENKSGFDSYDLYLVINCIHNYEIDHDIKLNGNVTHQIRQDISVYKKYDAIAMWVDDDGLIEHEPEFIRELVKIFGIK